MRFVTVVLLAGALSGSGGFGPSGGCGDKAEADLAGRWDIVFDGEMTSSSYSSAAPD